MPVFFEECLKIVVVYDIYVRPVVKACPFQALVIGLEAKRMHKVQCGRRGSAEPGDIAGIGRYFWFYQHDIQVNFDWRNQSCLLRHSGHSPVTSSLCLMIWYENLSASSCSMSLSLGSANSWILPQFMQRRWQ